MTGYAGRRVLVTGAGISGASAARVLSRLGAQVTVADDRDSERLAGLRDEGLAVVVGATAPPPGTELVVTSPGWRPDHPLLTAGAPVLGDVELAWRLSHDGGPGADVPWLAVTGTNGKTTTTRMLTSVLRAAGLEAVACGNVGLPVLDAVLAGTPLGAAGPPPEVLAVELSSFQLHWSASLRPSAAAVLNIAPDHLDWHGSLDAYARTKARVWAGATSIGNADDETTRTLLARAPGRRVMFTVQAPRPGEVGVVEDLLVDRAFTDDPRTTAEELASTADVRPPGPHNVANALAAAALARAHGVPLGAVREGLLAYAPDPHRVQHVLTRDGVTWVDDSKATNPHAAAASLAAYAPVVWVAGGLLKGASVDALVARAAPGLRAAVLIGRDRAEIAEALARHAPQIPVVLADPADTDPVSSDVPTPEVGLSVMTAAVAAAHSLARDGDTVLLAPAAASMDQFRDYAARGDAFAAAVRTAAGTARP